jgi:hypothetical protein
MVAISCSRHRARATSSAEHAGSRQSERSGRPIAFQNIYELFPFCEHIDALHLDTTLLTKDDYADLCHFRYVESVHLSGKLNQELADSLATLPRLRTLDGDVTAWGGFPGAPELKPLLNPGELHLLDHLPQLRELKLGSSPLLPADIIELAQRPNLKRLQICSPDLLIEDIVPLAHSKSLEVVALSIPATADEIAAFKVRHPRQFFDWPTEEFNGDSLLANSAEQQSVCDSLDRRWQREDGSSQAENTDHFSDTFLCLSSAFADPSGKCVTDLDFSRVRLTLERLRRIPFNSFPQVESVVFGEVDSVATVMELLRRCGSLKKLDARRVALSAKDLSELSFQEDASLDLQQGPLSVPDLCAFARKHKPYLILYAANITTSDAEQIDASGDRWFEAYKHYGVGNADAEVNPDRIYPKSDNGSGPDNPFQ